MRFLVLLSVCAGALARTPVVTLDFANVTGVNVDGSIDKFLGIPYAVPPVGWLRFRKAFPLPRYREPVNATAYGASCVQTKLSPVTVPTGVDENLLESIFGIDGPESEDCLTLNVIKPSFANEKTAFPVIYWIHPGEFQVGSSAKYDELGTRIVKRSVELSSPVIFVSINFRLSAFGFLGGSSIRPENEGNNGLTDQRVAFLWARKYIAKFGGDPLKVMLWGQGSGATAVALHMIAYGGTAEGLFHAAFMQSGGPVTVGDINDVEAQFEQLVNDTRCATDPGLDKLECLRGVPLDELKKALEKVPDFLSYESLRLSWLPRVDGIVFYENPQTALIKGKVAHIPFVAGNCDDEGTIFSFSTQNITTEEQFRNYFKSIWLPSANATELESLWGHYPSDPAAGSPFDTGGENASTPQFKRFAALQGDIAFHSSRRLFVQNASAKMKAWSYLSKRGKFIPIIGSYHSSDLGLMDDYVIRMATNHDPNNGTSTEWPIYTTDSPTLYTFPSDELKPVTTTEDNYRTDAIQYITELFIAHPF